MCNKKWIGLVFFMATAQVIASEQTEEQAVKKSL